MASGTHLGPYQVTALVGAGGMGEVYRARDPRLERDVAIKVLPPEFAADSDRLRRFEQEARAASALNHPNILVVHDVGTHQGAPYLVTELLEGESLRERLKSGALPAHKAVELAVQVASGLAAAHDKAIVHRDLKPENLFVTRDGRVKILDFGLAKLRPALHEAAAAPTGVQTTQAGMVLGTVAYMSPEQVRGQAVDHRSDIFSFGAVLYEMVTGQPAFARGTPADTVSAILKEEPAQPASLQPATPLPLARAIAHCLEKNPEERFQSVRDLAFDLQGITGISAVSVPAAGLPARSSWRRVARALAAIGLATALFAAGFFLAGSQTARPPESPTFTRLTFQRGSVKSARFMPDGKGVLYSAAWDGGLPEVFETRADLSTNRPLGLSGVTLLSVSRAGELAVRRQGERFNLNYGPLAVAPSSGSAPRDLLEDVSCADWSPDGKTLAVVRRVSGEDCLEMPPGHVLVRTSGWFDNIRLSPDGRRIAFTEHPVVLDDRGSVALVDPSGRKTTLTNEFFGLAGLAWSPDGREIWFSGSPTGPRHGLFAVTPEGQVRPIARFPSNIGLFDVAPDGRVLLESGTVWSGIRGRSSTGDKERELGWLDFPWPKRLSFDGSVLLLDDVGETAGPTYTVYLRAMDGSPPVRLGAGCGCALSPDGLWALAIHFGPPQRLVLIPTGPGDPRSLPPGQVETYQDGEFLSDGRRVVFVGAERGRPQRTWIQELRGGLPSAVTPEGAVGVTTSPDGRWVAAVAEDLALVLYPLQGGEPRRVATLAPREAVTQWSADGRTLFAWQAGTRLDVFGIDVQSGRRPLWKTFEVPDPAGVRYSAFVLTRDARGHAYGYTRRLGGLYLVEGLR